MAEAPTESRIPVFFKQPSTPSQLPILNAYAVRNSASSSRPQNEKPNKRPSSLLELFGRNKVGALPVTAKVNPMSAGNSTKTSVVTHPQKSSSTFSPTSSEKLFSVQPEKILSGSEVVKNSRISDVGKHWDPKVTSSPSEVKNDVTSPVTASHVGHRVCVSGTKVGILRYFGEIELTEGTFCGIELDEPAGLNDGSLHGVCYFTCRPQHGIFAPVHIVKPLPGGSWTQPFRRKLSPDAFTRRRNATFVLDDSSGPYSLLDGLDTPEEDIPYHMEKNGDVPETGQEAILSSILNKTRVQMSSGSAPTTSSAANNAALWHCRQQLSCSVGTLTSSESRKQSEPSQETSKQSSLELDESLGILTPDQLHTTVFDLTGSAESFPFPQSRCQSEQSKELRKQSSMELDENTGIQTPDQLNATVLSSSQPNQCHNQQISKQSSFELDESLGILTPDQMIDFTVCAENSSVGRTPSFEDMGIFLLTDLKGDRAEDLPDRLPSESDGPSSSNYPSSEFPQFPGDITDGAFQSPDGMNMEDESYLVSKAEDVSMQELDLLSNDATTPDQQHCASNQVLDLTMCCTSEELSDNVCPAITSNGSDGDFTPASIRVGQDISDRTLSPEDLPMDAPYQEVMGEILQKAELTSESGHETAGMSGATSAGPSSRSSAAPPPPSSFVTSVTSITSLDNGYQGDGEWSRPASRGADHSPTSHRVIKLKNSAATADPMTDSDFFTESDADMHDELATGTGRGDRRAQVIDGTLYGANLQAGGAVVLGQHHQRCPSFTASINEEMESSGVYSDLERRPDDVASDGKEFHGEGRTPVEAVDFSPDVSTKTVSSRSEQSQVKEPASQFTTIISQSPCENSKDMTVTIATPETIDSNELISENNLKNQQQVLVVNKVIVEHADCSLDRTQHKKDSPSSGAPGLNKSQNSTTSSVLSSGGSKSSKDDGHHQLKKYKMPKRNVVSKIKAMIENPSTSNAVRSGGNAITEDENQENRRPTTKSMRKGGGRWDAVMNKIAQGQAEQKLKTRSLKEVKSKVFANIAPVSTTQGEARRNTERTRNTSSSSTGPSSSRALKENSPLKVKSRRARTRSSTTSLSQQQQSQGNTNGTSHNSSPHSSMSDVSVNQSHALSKASTKSSSSLRSSKKRDVGRSTSPLSDGSTNSTTSHVMTRSASNHINNHHSRTPGHNSAGRERVLRDNVNRLSDAKQNQRQPRSLLSSVGANKLIGRKSSSTSNKEKNGVNVAAVVDMKTPLSRKQASRRSAPSSVQKPTPLRDHNRQQQASGGGGVFKTGGETPPSNKPGEVSVPPQRSPSATQPQPTLAELLLPQLRHNSAGFEALSVVVQYLVYSLDAFSTPQLKKDLENMKTEWLKTKLELEEAQVSYRRIEDALSQEKALCNQKLEELESTQHQELVARDTKHSHELAELVARHEAQLSDLENRLHEQLEEMRSRYEAEMSHAQHLYAEKLEEVKNDNKSHLEQLQQEHEAAIVRLQSESSERENQLRSRLSTLEEEYSGLKTKSRKLMDSMQQDKDTKLQATAGRCKELQDEVESLRTVLDLRHEELQDLRKQNALLIREAEELPVALQRVAALEAKVEDLQVQLEMKTNLERQLSQDNRLLMESVHQESKQNKRLSLYNEELQWKLKQNFEVVNVLAALSGNSMNTSMTGSLHNSSTNGRSAHGSALSLSDADPLGAGSQLLNTRTPPRPLSAGRSQATSGSDLSSSSTPLGRSVFVDDLEISPPASPKVKGVVEKSDSVSWVVDLDETPQALVSRLVRRAGSFRGTTPPPSSVPSPAHSRTLPPPKRQRCKASSLSLSSSATTIARSSVGSQSRNTPFTSSLRSRSRSVSTDSVEGMGLDYNSWAPTTATTNTITSSPLQGAVTNGALKRQTSECSNDEDSPSKSTGSSGSSEGSVQKDREHSCRRSRKQVSESLEDPSGASDSLDLGDTEILPLPPLPGSTSGDLSLLAAQPLPPMPKESAGEAMISEETSEDENDNDDEINSSSDEHSCSEDEDSSSSSSSGSSSDIGPVASRGLVVHEDGEMENTSGNIKQEEEEELNGRANCKHEINSGQQNMTSSTGSLQQYQLLLMSDSGSYSATTTTMDLSWSEDMELMPSESDG